MVVIHVKMPQWSSERRKPPVGYESLYIHQCQKEDVYNVWGSGGARMW